MYTLKIRKLDDSLNFGWQFPTEQECHDKLTSLKDNPQCPYKDIVEYEDVLDDEENVIGQEEISRSPHPDWEIIIEEVVADPAVEIAELQEFLTKTDWMVIRKAESGVDYPEDIKTQRAAARTRISELRGE